MNRAAPRRCGSSNLADEDRLLIATTTSYLRHQGRDNDTYYSHLRAALEHKPQFHHGRRRRPGHHAADQRTDLVPDVIAGTEETTTGVIRLRAMAKDGTLKYPIIAVNDAMTKHFFDNRYAPGQSHD